MTLYRFVKEGDQISEFDKIANVQSDKATVEITSPYNGEIVKLYGQSGTMIQVGKPLVDIMTTSHQQSKIKFTDKDEHKTTKDTLATPAVRGLAKDMGVKLDSFVPGSGSDGRIMKHDLNTQKQTSDTEEPFKLVEMTAFQKSMVKSMELSMNIPHFSYSEKVIMDPAIQLRKVLQTETSMTKFSFMPFWIKATSIALKDFPILNASIVEQDGQGTMIKYHNDHNIAIAMDTPQGLAVPIIHKVQCKSIFEIASELDILMEKGKNNTLSKQDICNGTFSLSNIGSIGTGIGAIPVVLSPQVCIGALCRIQQELDLNRNESDNQYKIVSAMTVHWSADHRLIDGATLARFSGKWKILVENPLLLLADMK